MPDIIAHATTTTVKYGGYGTLGSAVALLFDVPPNVVASALIGSLLAVMLLHTFNFRVAAFVVTLGTFSSSYAVPFIHEYVSTSQKGVAFFFAFGVIYFWSILNEMSRDIVKTAIETIKKRIKRLGGNND
jgi:hypothetical protein